MKAIRVLVNGAKGRMGQEAVKAISAENGLVLVAQTDLGDSLKDIIASSQAQVVVDFTTALTVFENTKLILDAGARPVIGTSGLLSEQVKEIQALGAQRKLGGLIAPNFAIGAVLMMKFAQEATKYFPQAEIIELHHDKKVDAPSGTAIKTAAMIAEARTQAPPKLVEKELLPGARGAKAQEVPIHSVRLPGLMAHQEVIFGGLGQTLTIRHDSIDRSSFMPGVCLACKKVVDLREIVYGLEHLLRN